MKVKDVYETHSDFAETVNPDDNTETVIAVLGENKETRTVFVVDSENHVKGIITIKEIFDALFEEMKPNLMPKFMEKFKKNKTKKASDIMKSPLIVTPQDELEDALRTAKAGNLQDLPICEKGKLVGALDCFELLYGLVNSKKKYFE